LESLANQSLNSTLYPQVLVSGTPMPISAKHEDHLFLTDFVVEIGSLLMVKVLLKRIRLGAIEIHETN
jgi:hypothetical protein